MAYNTGNSVPSRDPRDLLDNAESLDIRATSLELRSTPDRLGVPRKTWYGMEQDFADFLARSGFEPVHLIYQDGVALQVDRPTQLIDYSGSVYRVKMPASFPVMLSGTWATDSALLVQSQDQSLRQDLADSANPAKGAGLVGYRDIDAATGIAAARPVELPNVATIAAAGLRAGARCSVNGSIFEISTAPPRDVRLPVVSAGVGLYAIPVDALDRRLGAFNELHEITDAAKYAEANGRTHQAILVDNQNSRLFVTAAITPDANPQKAHVYEYDFTGGVVGDLLASSGLITLGHADFIAITAGADGRRLWFYRPSSGTYAGGGDVCSLTWANGVTDAAIDIAIPVAPYVTEQRAEVQNYDAEHLSIRGADSEGIFICRISDLESGVLSPVEVLPTNPGADIILVSRPQQQFAGINGWWFGYSGLHRKVPYSGYLVASDAKGGRLGAYFHDPDAPADAEIEGVAWSWNPVTCKLETVLSDWRKSAGSVGIIAVCGANAPYRAELPLIRKSKTLNINQWGTGTTVLEAPSPLSAPAFAVGGITGLSNQSQYDPADLVIEQWSNIPGGRQGSRLMAYGGPGAGGMSLLFDGPDDSAYAPGFRVEAGGTKIQADADGVSVGYARQKSASRSAVMEIRGEKAGAYASGTPAGFVSAALGPDFAVPSGQSMQLGEIDLSTGTTADWYTATANWLAAASDNGKSLGIASLRWSVVYAGTGTINTSDAREKQQIRELSDAERAVAVRLKSLVRAYKFNDAVAAKGDGARIHVGWIAQEVVAAFEAEGLVAEDYALLCYDEWPEQREERDENGNVVQEYRPAGSRYGVRYEELLAFIIAVS